MFREEGRLFIRTRIEYVLTALFAMLLVCFLLPETVFAVEETGRENYDLYEGVTEATVYVADRTAENIRLHILRIDRAAGVSFKVSTKQYYNRHNSKAARKKFAQGWSKKKWGFATVEAQAKSYEKTSDRLGEVIAAVNGDFYEKKENGKTLGVLIMEGNEIRKSRKEPYFAIMKDGRREIRDRRESTNKVAEAISGEDWLLKDGVIQKKKDKKRMPIMAIGVTRKQDVVIVSSDGREPSCVGTTLYDMACIMRQQGCVDAINLDCGGSASFMTRAGSGEKLTYRNVVSDGIPRPISSALLIVKDRRKNPRNALPNIYPADMSRKRTALTQDKQGYLKYRVKGKAQPGIRMVNGVPCLFDKKGRGMSRKVKIADATYTFTQGRLVDCSDKLSGEIAMGVCGTSRNGRDVLYAYHYGDNVIRIGPDPVNGSGRGKMSDWKNMNQVPWRSELYRIRAVQVGEGIKHIGTKAFNIQVNTFNTAQKNAEGELRSISLPNSLRSIGARSFYNEAKLKEVVLPKAVRVLSKESFDRNRGTSFVSTGKNPLKIEKNALRAAGGRKSRLSVPDTQSWRKYLNKKTRRRIGAGEIIHYS